MSEPKERPPRPQLHARIVPSDEVLALREWIMERHYTRTAPSACVLAVEFRLDSQRIGGMMVGTPNARGIDPSLWLELTRMHFVDETPPSIESQGLALMRKAVRTEKPAIKALIAYANPEIGHEGTVYLADGWAPFGLTRTRKEGWTNRPGRKHSIGDTAAKRRYVRTP